MAPASSWSAGQCTRLSWNIGSLLFLTALCTAAKDVVQQTQQQTNVIVKTEPQLRAALLGSKPISLAANIFLTKSLPNIAKTVSIAGLPATCKSFNDERCMIHARKTGRHFTVVQGGRLFLSGILLRGGVASGNGGSVLINAGGAVSARNVAFRFNYVLGSLSSGGAIEVVNGGRLAVVGCDFFRNAAAFGGAIDVAGGSVASISGCIFHNNTASIVGGDLSFIVGARGVVTQSKLTVSFALVGASIYADSSTLTLCNLAFAKNTASLKGGYILGSKNSQLSTCNLPKNSITLETGAKATQSCKTCPK